ncbi:exosome complex protein Rrp42 [Candidatus Micrarchaeota archaeon]|nr:exosome complex protein Rrp42 [Candidatus Micrarchaeota archaeon]
MGEEIKNIILTQIRKDSLSNLLKKGERYDGRKEDEYREMKVHKGVIGTAEGSALANIGETKVLAAVKFDIMTPFPDRPEEGVFITNAELLPLASPDFESGPPRENAIELARVVDRGIRSAGAIDMSNFFIEEGKVLGVFLDLYVLDHSGNLIDTAALAGMAAFLDAKFPKIEDGKIISGEDAGELKILETPLSTTFIKVGEHILCDPSKDEEYAMDSRLNIAGSNEHLFGMQKGGAGSFTKEEVLEMVERSFSHTKKMRKLI